MSRMHEYIEGCGDREFCWHERNCVHFVLDYYGLAHRVPNDPKRLWRNAHNFMDEGLAQEGFIVAELPYEGNIVMTLENKLPMFGLRYDSEYVAYAGVVGVVLKNKQRVEKEWRKA